VLTQPKAPDIPGLADFAGHVMHTARWDHAVDLRGKRVAIIGTGASAVQVIPEIAPLVEHLVVFQRTPIWCMPKPDYAIDRRVQWALRRVPLAQAAARMASQALVEVTIPLSAHFHRHLPFSKRAERACRAFLKKEVRDPEVRHKLTPRYALGCKRPTFHNAYLSTFNRDNVTLETTPIEAITPRGLRVAGGEEHRADTLVLATGFKVFDSGNMPCFPVRGLGGADLERFWSERRRQAYQGVSVPGFPNYFMIIGPYAYNGASYFHLIESQMSHIVRCLSHARRRGATRIEVTREANDRYWREMLRRRKSGVFAQASCALANSYYFDQHGDIPLRSAPSLEVSWKSAHFDLADYSFADG
jgi:cation diffusion facilitator CzcD-associated flavoprotein CzcO